jgi:hypothetical protein
VPWPGEPACRLTGRLVSSGGPAGPLCEADGAAHTPYSALMCAYVWWFVMALLQQKDEFPTLLKERDELRPEITALFDEMRSLRDEYKKANDIWWGLAPRQFAQPRAAHRLVATVEPRRLR